MPLAPLVLTLCGLMALSISVEAADPENNASARVYVGIGAAALTFDYGYDGIPIDDTSAGLAVYGGFRIHNELAIELSYDGFEAINLHDVVGSGVERFDVRNERRTWAISVLREISLRELFGWQRDWRVYGSVGVYDSEIDQTTTLRNSTSQISVRDDIAGALLGAGVLYRVGKVDLRGYARWFGVLDLGEASEAGVGVQLHF